MNATHPCPLSSQREGEHVQKHGASSQNLLHSKLKEPQSGAICIEERTPIYPPRLFEKLPFRNELLKRLTDCTFSGSHRYNRRF